ncbi:MAG TPA: hypothetical protein VIN33_05290 [Marinobacter sp.]
MFTPGDTLTLDLIMNMPFENIHAEGVSGLVTERRKHCSNFFYSIDFIKTEPSISDSLGEKLQRIREVVSKKQSLRSRRSSGSGANLRNLA